MHNTQYNYGRDGAATPKTSVSNFHSPAAKFILGHFNLKISHLMI